MGSDDNRMPGSQRGLSRTRQASGRVALPVKVLLIWLALLLLVPGLTGCGSRGPAPVDNRNQITSVLAAQLIFEMLCVI